MSFTSAMTSPSQVSSRRCSMGYSSSLRHPPTQPWGNHRALPCIFAHRRVSGSSSAMPKDRDDWVTSRNNVGGAVLSMAAFLGSVMLTMESPVYAVSGGGGMGTSLSFSDFSGQDLSRKNFNKADLRGANLTGTSLEGAQMFGAICSEAKFVGANLRYADLESADLEGADLSNAVLEGAMLTNTQFRAIKSIEGADFTDALIRKDVAKALCGLESAKGTNPETGVDTRESLNCGP